MDICVTPIHVCLYTSEHVHIPACTPTTHIYTYEKKKKVKKNQFDIYLYYKDADIVMTKSI